MYVVEIHDQNCLIAMGKLNKNFEKKDIYYVPIHLVDGENVISKIGVFEFNKEKEPTIYDAEMDYDLDKFDEPLLFSFVTKDYIIENTASLDIPEISVEDSPDGQDYQEEEPKGKHSSKFPFQDDDEQLNDLQTLAEAKSEVSDYDENHNNYEIEKVSGDGDCFFSVLKEAFIGIPLKIEIQELREILSNHADEETFQIRKERFEMFKTELNIAKLSKKEVDKKYR